MEVIQVPDRPASPSFYAVAGRLLFVESLDLRLGNLIARLFSGWQLTPVPCPNRSSDIRIKFFCGDAPPKIPNNLKHFQVAEGGDCYTDGADFYLTLGDALIHLQNGSPVAVDVWLAELPGPTDAMFARATSFAVCAALRRYGLFDLHSAGVVDPVSEDGVLIIGPSGSGKSTLAHQLAVAGWPYLSDDELLLSVVDNEVEARGFRSFFAVREGQPGVGLRNCFEPETVFESKRRLSTLPRLLFFISLSGRQNTELNHLSQMETMARLIRACPWASYDTSVAGANLRVLSALTRQANGFDLSAGRDLLEPLHASDLLSSASALKAKA